jgi:hypothetical protein
MLTSAIQKVSSYALEHSTCILCGAPPVYGAAFIPNHAHEKRYGAKPGKRRALGYALCQKCHDLPDVKERVEARLLFQPKRSGGKDIRSFSQDQAKELSEFLEGQPCSLCNSLTDHFLQRELDEKESTDFGIKMLVTPVCDSCMKDPGVYDRLEDHLCELRKSKEKKVGKVLSMLSNRKKRWKK